MKGYYSYQKNEDEFEDENEQLPEEEEERPSVKWRIFKEAASLAASGCSSVVVNRCLKSVLPPATTIPMKIVTVAGTYFIVGLVSAKVSEQCEADIDEWHDSVKEIRKMRKIKKAKEEEETDAR